MTYAYVNGEVYDLTSIDKKLFLSLANFFQYTVL